MKDIEHILADLVKFNTVRDAQRTDIMDYIRDFLSDYGFTFRDVNGNLVATRGSDARLGFLAHTDTVSAGGSWRTDPWELTTCGDRLQGLGACDMKGGIAVILTAAAHTPEPLKLYFTYDEEIGFAGISELLKSNENFPGVMLVGESTEGNAKIASKGLYEIRVEFPGTRVHSSNPDKGNNAIIAAANFITELHDFSKKLRMETDEEFKEAPFTTFNVGQISGGDSVNTTAENCWLTVDFCTISAESQEKCRIFIKKLIEKYHATNTVLNDISPFSNLPHENLRKILGKNLGTAIGLTEASFLPEKCQKIILGPGPNTEHEANEFISRESLTRLTHVYERLIHSVV